VDGSGRAEDPQASELKTTLRTVARCRSKLSLLKRRCNAHADASFAFQPVAVKKEAALQAASWFQEFNYLPFEPEPIGVRPAPVRATLFIAADQNAEMNAGFPVALFAELMEADYFRLHGALRVGR
jgi:hypothetical protein